MPRNLCRFDEFATIDLPAMVDYALETSGKSMLNYIGHSQGTLLGFIQFSENKEWAKAKVKEIHS